MSKYGQLMEHAPFCETGYPGGKAQNDRSRRAISSQNQKKGLLYNIHYETHPFDVVGWDGYLLPYVFSIHDFEPITGRVHQPPPVHQTFQTDLWFVLLYPRLYDYHPQAIPGAV